MLQLHLSDQQFYCLLRCDLYQRFVGSWFFFHWRQVQSNAVKYCYNEVQYNITSYTAYSDWDNVIRGWIHKWHPIPHRRDMEEEIDRIIMALHYTMPTDVLATSGARSSVGMVGLVLNGILWFDWSFRYFQCFLLILGIILVAGVINPWVFIPTLPLAIVFLLVRRYFLRTSRDIKRLEATSRCPEGVCHQWPPEKPWYFHGETYWSWEKSGYCLGEFVIEILRSSSSIMILPWGNLLIMRKIMVLPWRIHYLRSSS